MCRHIRHSQCSIGTCPRHGWACHGLRICGSLPEERLGMPGGNQMERLQQKSHVSTCKAVWHAPLAREAHIRSFALLPPMHQCQRCRNPYRTANCKLSGNHMQPVTRAVDIPSAWRIVSCFVKGSWQGLPRSAFLTVGQEKGGVYMYISVKGSPSTLPSM